MSRHRVQLLGALVFGAVIPYLLRSIFWPGTIGEGTSHNALAANAVAIALGMWVRMSVGTYPGVRASALILPAASACHLFVIIAIVFLRLDYDRVALLAGYTCHLVWLYIIYFAVQRGCRPLIAVVPWGQVDGIELIRGVDWVSLERPDITQVCECDAVVADFDADLPKEWEAFLADVAIEGRIVYQVKQLSESLTGRVEINHISENSFGCLMPARGYFHLKEVIDFLFSILVLPVVLPLILLVALTIKVGGNGPVFFRQVMVGYSGFPVEVLKFRTMNQVPANSSVNAPNGPITINGYDRITRVGSFLRRTRLDKLPQIWNVLKGEMSWIGPRPEARVSSNWYTDAIPFYRYRHVVKPGMSGWAAVNQDHVAEFDEVLRQLQYDFYYIKYFSPWLDLLIVFRTIRDTLKGS